MVSLIIRWAVRVFATLLVVGLWLTTDTVDACAERLQANLKYQQHKIGQDLASQRSVGPTPNAWRDLVPLQSTRVDVERLLGKPELSHGFTYIYKTDSERVDVLYSAGCCQLSGTERWNVPVDTVIKMEVSPTRKILVQELHLDKEKYVRIQEAHPDNWIMYWNTEDGVMVHTMLSGGHEEVMSVTYQPRAKDKPLRCA